MIWSHSSGPRVSVWLLWGLSALMPGVAWSLEDCSPYLLEVERKISAAEAAGQDAEIARQMHAQIPQMCAFLDAAALRSMVDSLDQLLPLLSEMKSQAADAEKLVAEETAAQAAPVAITYKESPEIGSSVGGGLIERPDAMRNFGIWDMDVYQGQARVTYHTLPDRLQAAQDDWELVSYLVTMDADAGVTQQLLDRRQSSDQGALALRRGADEVVMQWQHAGDDQGPMLERYAGTSGRLLGRVPAPVWPAGGAALSVPFQSVTSRGGLLYIMTLPAPVNAPTHTLAWYEASPDGNILSQGSLTREEGISSSVALEGRHGGGASVLVVRALNDAGVDSRLATPLAREVGGRSLLATVGMEKRLLVISGSEFWESPAIERMLIWQGDVAVPQSLGATEMVRQSQAQMAIMAETELAHGVGRTVRSLNVGFRKVEMIKPLSSDRFLALVDQVADRKLTPPRHGQYLLAVDAQAVETFAYLEPVAEADGVTFTALTTSPSGATTYLLARPDVRGESHRIYQLAADGSVRGYGRMNAAEDITVEGLVADDGGVWAFGRGGREGVIGDRLYAERVAFPGH